MEVALQDPSFTKVCPRCGERLFRDMSICYGCLYDFSNPQPLERRPESMVQDAAPAGVQGAQERLSKKPKADPENVWSVPEMAGPASGEDEEEWQDNEPTADLARQARQGAEAAAQFGVFVAGQGMEVHVPAGTEGITVGRAPSNDIVLRLKPVSRHHLRLSSSPEGLLVEDLGATNPATFRGRPLRGSVAIAAGERFEVCGIPFAVERRFPS